VGGAATALKTFSYVRHVAILESNDDGNRCLFLQFRLIVVCFFSFFGFVLPYAGEGEREREGGDDRYR
jgi:hypothetical protein